MFHLRVSRLGAARTAAALIGALCVAFLLAGRSDATSIRLPLSELSARSPLVVQGRVERLEATWTPERTIETTVYLRLSDVPRGHLSTGALIPIRVRGGTVDSVTMISSEEPTFSAGEDVFLFLASLTGGAYRVAEGQQGKFEVAGDGAINRAWQTTFSLADLRTGVQEGRWPASEHLDGGAPAPAASPDGYVANPQHWPGSRPMEENYVVNVNTGDAGGGNGSVDAFRSAIIAGGNAWSNAGANFAFHYGGGSGVTSSGNDGQNVIHWENMGNSSTLAESTWWYSGDQIVEADIRFNDYYSWDVTGNPSSNEVDLQSVATHELGHWLSLGHDTDGGCPNSSAIMCASYTIGTLKRSLGPNDIAGIKAIYGPGQPPATTVPQPTSTPKPTRRPTLAPWQIKSRVRLPMILRVRP